MVVTLHSRLSPRRSAKAGVRATENAKEHIERLTIDISSTRAGNSGAASAATYDSINSNKQNQHKPESGRGGNAAPTVVARGVAGPHLNSAKK